MTRCLTTNSDYRFRFSTASPRDFLRGRDRDTTISRLINMYIANSVITVGKCRVVSISYRSPSAEAYVKKGVFSAKYS